ncbi:MAG: heparinase II/III family protein [Alphaproteobacteria bacterium]|nr:heparinase II/III family protein [Alphaproteobacteria bacterium]
MSSRPLPTPAPQPEEPAEDGIERGKRLIRVSDDRGHSLAERLANHFYRMSWATPFHNMRLKGKYPLKLLAVPDDGIPGDPRAGQALRAGYFLFRGLKQPVPALDWRRIEQPAEFVDYLHGFRWLRDLAAATTRDNAVPVAESQMRAWLTAHAEKPSEPAWRVDNAGWRLLHWTAFSPLILSSNDLVYRSLVLNSIARTARHLDRGADKAPLGLPRVIAWTGIVAAGLLLPGGDPRRIFGEAGLRRALESGFSGDGGIISRSPLEQVEAITLLAMLRAVYDVRRTDLPVWLAEHLERMVAALLGILHGDGAPGSWQGGAPLDPARITAIVAASGIRTRPLRQARDRGYQRLSGGTTVVQVDAAPPPVARLASNGCASTAALEVSDGPVRLIVNCGGAALAGAALPANLTQGLRTTAAHSTLVLDDTNSTAILPDGALGKGVSEVELDRQEHEQGSRLEIAHDGYARRLGHIHRRTLVLTNEGRELRGEDVLLPGGRRRKPVSCPLAIRFHLGPDVEPTLTADKQGALLRLPSGALWQFRVGAGELAVEDSLWVDGEGRPHPTQQLVVNADTGPGGTSIGWLLKKSG